MQKKKEQQAEHRAQLAESAKAEAFI